MTNRKRIIIDGCTRCGGDLFLDTFEEELYCLQCSRRASLTSLFNRQIEGKGGVANELLGQTLESAGAGLVAASR